MKKKIKTCSICKIKFKANAHEERCGRACFLLYQARKKVKTAKQKLFDAEKRLKAIEKDWKNGTLTDGREAYKMEVNP